MANACVGPSIDYISINFGVGSSNRFSFTAWTDRQTDSKTQLKALVT